MTDEKKIAQQLKKENEDLRQQLSEANDLIEAIRTGQVDALIVEKDESHELYTLNSADQAYRIFIEKMTEGAVTLNNRGVILYCNSSFAGMLDEDLFDVIGKSFEEFLTVDSRNDYKGLFAHSHDEDAKGECSLASKNGFIPVQLSFASIKEKAGESIRSVIVTDLRSQKMIQRELEKNNKALEATNHALAASNMDLMRFASVASHDLQEPVRKIQVFSTLLEENEAKNLSADSAKYLSKIIRSASRMKSLILNMLEYSKLSDKKEERSAVDLNDILDEVKEDLELTIKEKSVSITSDSLPEINANPGLIRQVFQNIISNAAKFCPPERPCKITISKKRITKLSFTAPESENGRFWLLTFKDNGIGFDESYAEQIFHLFHRLNAKDAYEGSGIGLAIARKIIEMHHGIISAKSNDTEGAQFLIILPVI